MTLEKQRFFHLANKRPREAGKNVLSPLSCSPEIFEIVMEGKDRAPNMMQKGSMEKENLPCVQHNYYIKVLYC